MRDSSPPARVPAPVIWLTRLWICSPHRSRTGLVVFCLAALPNLRRVGISVAAANSVYTLAAIVVAAVVPTTTTAVGATLAGAVYTAIFAVLQYLGVRRLAP